MTASRQSPRYEVLGRIAQGGMSSVHLARMTDSSGDTRLVAVKRLHPEFAADQDFVATLSEEAGLSAAVQHPNVVGILDLTTIEGGLSLVLEYVEGESLAELVKRASERKESLPLAFAVTIMHGVLCGLDAAHAVQLENGMPAGIVHGEVSPQSILVGVDGIAKLTGLGFAEAKGALDVADSDELVAYAAPEQLRREAVTAQVDIHAAGVVLWELLAGRPLYSGHDVRRAVLSGAAKPPSAFNPSVNPALDDVVMRAITPHVYERYATADEFAAALEPWCKATERAIGAWVSRLAVQRLATQRLLHQSAEPWVESSASISKSARITGTKRPGGSTPPAPSDRTVVMPYTYTPGATPSVRPSTDPLATSPWSALQTKLRRVHPVILACGGAAVVACILAITTKSEPEVPLDTFAVPAPPADPPVNTEPPEPDPPPIPSVTAPIPTAAPAASSVTIVRPPPIRRPAVIASSRPLPTPLVPERVPPNPLDPSKASSDTPKPPAASRDYR